MKKIAAALSASLLALTILVACEDPHEGEHCVDYDNHTHVTTTGTGKTKHTRIYTTRDCVRWEKNS